jgi:hypothetical protein
LISACYHLTNCNVQYNRRCQVVRHGRIDCDNTDVGISSSVSFSVLNTRDLRTITSTSRIVSVASIAPSRKSPSPNGKRPRGYREKPLHLASWLGWFLVAAAAVLSQIKSEHIGDAVRPGPDGKEGTVTVTRAGLVRTGRIAFAYG